MENTVPKQSNRWRKLAVRIGLFLAWSTFGLWLPTSTVFVSFLFYAIGDGAAKVEGLKGNVEHGISFANFSLHSEQKNVEIENFNLSYDSPLSILREGTVRIKLLRAKRVIFEEIRLEKPSAVKLRADLERIVASLQGLALAPQGRLMKASIDKIEIDEIIYRTSLAAPPIVLGPILVSDFTLTKAGWVVQSFKISGKQIQGTVEPESKFLHLQANLASEIFSDTNEPFLFVSFASSPPGVQ